MALPVVGLLGVGRMGAPILRRLRAAGYEVHAFDPRTRTTESGTEVAAVADVLVTVLPGVPEADAAMPGALDALPSGALWIDLTSNDPRVVARHAARHPGITVVGAPMSGGVSAAASGHIGFFVGGAPDAVVRATPLLSELGTIDYVGEDLGDGYTAKLLANLLWFGQVVAVSEALLLGQSLGIAPARLRRSLGSSAGGSRFIDEYLDRLLDGDYAESFGLDRVVEELEILASLAQSEGVPFELSAHVARVHREALERFGAVDGELLAAKLLEERAGRTLRR